MLLEAVPRLEDGRVGELRVQCGDRAIGSVVEAAIHADRPVHSVHHATAAAGEPSQPFSVEVERVEETRGRRSGEPIQLDLEPALLEFGYKGSQELVTASGRLRRELVEEREVSAPATRAEPVELNPPTSRDVS